MVFNDFNVFWNAARALMQGNDPYAVFGVYYPLPFFFVFLPLAALPLSIAQIVWTVLAALIFVAVLRRRAASTVLLMPVLLTFLMGQIVMPMLGVYALLRARTNHGSIALALMMFKPQLTVFIAPWLMWQWWHRDRRQILYFAGIVGVMLGGGFIVQPDWIARWLAVAGERMRAPISPSIWGVLSFLPTPVWLALSVLVTLGVFVWAWRQNNLDILFAASMLVNPVLISYDQTLLTPMIQRHKFWLVLTVLSWLLFAVSAVWLNEWLGVLIPLAVLIYLVKQKRELGQ